MADRRGGTRARGASRTTLPGTVLAWAAIGVLAAADGHAQEGGDDSENEGVAGVQDAEPAQQRDLELTQEPDPTGVNGAPEPGPSAEEQAAIEREALEQKLPSLDEAVDFEWSWRNLGGVLSGRETFLAHGGRVRFRMGTSGAVDGTLTSESQRLEDAFGPLESGVNLRRLEVAGHGSVDEMDFNLSVDFGADFGVNDAWLENREEGLSIWGRSLGKFRLGQTKEPFSFERQTSASFTGFLERSLPVQTFTPGLNIGGMLYDTTKDERQSWALGVFSISGNSDEVGSSSLVSTTGRWTGLPIYREQGRQLLHVGASVSSRNPGSQATEYLARPEARFVDPLAMTGPIEASRITLLGLEVAGVSGPYWAQAEWIQSRLEAPLVGNPWFSGSYVQVGYLFGTQSRPYRKVGGVFDRYRPELEALDQRDIAALNRNAWEVVGRVSGVDLNDGVIQGGKLVNYSLAVNWYVRNELRVQFNYIYSVPQNNGVANIFLLRMQYSPW